MLYGPFGDLDAIPLQTVVYLADLPVLEEPLEAGVDHDIPAVDRPRWR
jgi:hypothetical protein